jgi:hypothetical protein
MTINMFLMGRGDLREATIPDRVQNVSNWVFWDRTQSLSVHQMFLGQARVRVRASVASSRKIPGVTKILLRAPNVSKRRGFWEGSESLLGNQMFLRKEDTVHRTCNLENVLSYLLFLDDNVRDIIFTDE